MPPKEWTEKSRRSLFKSHIFNLTAKLSVNPRNNQQDEYYTADFPDWSHVIAITPDKEVVFIHQYRHGSERIEIELPGGCVDKGESPLDAGIRELEEETGYIGKKARIIGSASPNPAFQGNKCHTILIEDAMPTGQRELDDGEDIDVFTCPINQIDSLIDNGELASSMIIAALYFLKKAGIQF